MSDVEADIRKAVQNDRPVNRDETFLRLRSEIRGAVIRAHLEYTGPNHLWSPVDDRVLDILDRWLDNKAGRP